ncbi:hypothetical protein ZHAS_00020531 [Anopheles sinensis]|uniref:Methuselah N-terminal domain-containing protein n=1 Tax=Anopheles sinensis TaxID=74873 RepID=A0A084WQ37_ANOSI|nr:hypothetical protein ZHAS_00020531 [Anopheles sinensis]
MRLQLGYRRRWLLALVMLLVSLADGSLGTIDNATGAIRENSLPISSDVLSSVDPSNSAEIDQSTTTEVPSVSVDTTTIARSVTTPSTTTEETTSTTTAQLVSSTSMPTTTTSTTPPVPSTASVKTTNAASVATERSSTGDANNDDDALPPNCSEFNVSSIRLVYNEKAHIRKCCPKGQMIKPSSNECVAGNLELKIEAIEAYFYGNNECIEMGEKEVTLPVQGDQDQCRDEIALVYSADQNDSMYVLQNGSLLVLEDGRYVSVFDAYCVEMTNDDESVLLAKVCMPQSRWPRWLIVVGISLATVTLVFAALCYSFVPKLNTTFGYLIAAHAGTFAIGTIFLGLARCGDRCISSGSIGVTEMFANGWLGTSVFIFFLMNVFNTMHVAYYIPNGLEYNTKTNVRCALICIVFLYFGAIVVTHVLAYYFAGRLSSGNYRSIVDTAEGHTKIDQERLKYVNQQKKLCLMETVFSLLCWTVFTVLTLKFGAAEVAKVFIVYSVALQGMFIGLVYTTGRQRWTIIRECWSNSGSLNLRDAENGTEMKTLQRKMLPTAANGEAHE